MLDKIKQKVSELLKAKKVKVFVCHEKGDNPSLPRPVYINTPDDVDKIIFSDTSPILSKYLLKPEVKSYGKTGIVAGTKCLRGISGLIQEKQIDKSNVYVLAVSSEAKIPEVYDELIESDVVSEKQQKDSRVESKIKELMGLSSAQKWEFWKKEFSKCIKCYACRQICPLCYCRKCIADKNQPQWIPTSPHLKGNFSWNLIRAYHLSGRCIDCGECERACPVGISLMLLNKMIYNNVKNNFNYEAGFDPKDLPPLATYNPEDKENFII